MARVYTILVVDDDPDLIDLVTRVLEEPSYAVVTARDGFQAIRILADRHIDLMITDIRMPGLSGFELAAQAKLMQARLHVIYISGYYAEAREGRLPAYGLLLQKPVRPDALLATIRQEMTGVP